MTADLGDDTSLDARIVIVPEKQKQKAYREFVVPDTLDFIPGGKRR